MKKINGKTARLIYNDKKIRNKVTKLKGDSKVQ